jgi:hypothetical protein
MPILFYQGIHPATVVDKNVCALPFSIFGAKEMKKHQHG